MAKNSIVSDRKHCLSVDDAEALTGMTKLQAHKWRHRLGMDRSTISDWLDATNAGTGNSCFLDSRQTVTKEQRQEIYRRSTKEKRLKPLKQKQKMEIAEFSMLAFQERKLKRVKRCVVSLPNMALPPMGHARGLTPRKTRMLPRHADVSLKLPASLDRQPGRRAFLGGEG